MALVCKFEKSMMQLVQIMQKVTELTDKYKQKNLEKWLIRMNELDILDSYRHKIVIKA